MSFELRLRLQLALLMAHGSMLNARLWNCSFGQTGQQGIPGNKVSRATRYPGQQGIIPSHGKLREDRGQEMNRDSRQQILPDSLGV